MDHDFDRRCDHRLGCLSGMAERRGIRQHNPSEPRLDARGCDRPSACHLAQHRGRTPNRCGVPPVRYRDANAVERPVPEGCRNAGQCRCRVGPYRWYSHPDPDLRKADLSLVDKVGQNLWKGARFPSRLVNVQLQGADLRGAGLGGLDMRGASLSGTKLDAADLGGANLNGADLSAASLKDAKLGGADLSNARLGGPGADLSNADLTRANLASANPV